MTFNETLTELYAQTQTITVYAAQASNWIQDHNEPAIGIRSFFAGYEDHDPRIDGISFMICGTIYVPQWNFHECRNIVTLEEEPDASQFCVHLRAVAGGFPTATINLGMYRIRYREWRDLNGVMVLHLERM